MHHGGKIALTGGHGHGGADDDTGGVVDMKGGSSRSGSGGSISMKSGSGTSSSSGNIVIESVDAGSSGVSGSLVMDTGNTLFGDSGSLSVRTGNARKGKSGNISLALDLGTVELAAHYKSRVGRLQPTHREDLYLYKPDMVLKLRVAPCPLKQMMRVLAVSVVTSQ